MKILCLAQHKHDKKFFQHFKEHSPHTVTIQSKKHLPPSYIPYLEDITSAFRDNLPKNHFLLKRHPQPLLKKIFIRFYSAVLYAQAKKFLVEGSFSKVLMWNGNNWVSKAYTKAANSLGIQTFFFELGPLPKTLCCDPRGVNYENSLPRDAEFYLSLEESGFKQRNLVPRPRKIPAKEITLPGNYIFAPFQVESDSQIKLNSPWAKNMEEFYNILDQASHHLPKHLKFVIKEHPSCSTDHFALHSKNPKIIFANGNNTQKLIEGSTAVITINSSIGIEALSLGIKVITIGKAFYAINGLTLDAQNQQQLLTHIEEIEIPIPNNEVRIKFLTYLENEYLIQGELSDKTNINWDKINKKIEHS